MSHPTSRESGRTLLGPRPMASRPSSSKDLPPVPQLSIPSTPPSTPPEWAPLKIERKAPKLRLLPIDTSKAPDYYGQPQGDDQTPNPVFVSALSTSTATASERTLRPPNSSGDSSFAMSDVRAVIDGLSEQHRPKSRQRLLPPDSSSSTSSLTVTGTGTPNADSDVSPDSGKSSGSSALTSSTTAPSSLLTAEEQSTYDDEEPFSDANLTVLTRLGEGAGGSVYKVSDNRTGLVYARKTIPTRTTPAKQLMAELRHLSESQHDNICTFFGAYMNSSMSEVHVIMELCEGGSLEAIGQKIKERKLRTAEPIIGKLAEGILKGLTHLHTLKIIHRDIKPSNILLSLSGVVKLCDFGVSGELVDSMVETFTGTSFYMAPERVSGHPYSIRADVWSTGLSLVELAHNRFPLPEDLDGIIALIDYITHSPPIELQDDDEVQWSDIMKDFIRKCLTADPQERPYPRDLIQHPWVLTCASTMKDKHVASWVRQTWGITKPSRESRSEKEKADKKKRHQGSRPASRHEDTLGAGEALPTSHSSGDVPPWEM